MNRLRGSAPGVGVLVVFSLLVPAGARGDRISGELDAAQLGRRGVAIDGVRGEAVPIDLHPVGDVDGDGVADFILRFSEAPRWSACLLVRGGNTFAGHRSVAELRREGVTLKAFQERHLESSQAVPAGDLDADGFGDFFITAPYTDWPGIERSGRIYLLFGQPEFAPEYFLDEDGGRFGLRGVVFYSSRAWTRLGGGDPNVQDLAVLGDLDGDGWPEFAFSAPFSAVGERSRAGRIFVFSWRPELAAGGTIDVERFGRDLPGFIVEGADRGYLTGIALAGPGDANGDGIPDILLGATRQDRTELVEGGLIYLIYGARSPPARLDLAELGARGVRMHGAPIIGGHGPNGLGYTVAGPGDLDGDGLADLVIGLEGNCCDILSPSTRGRAYVVRGRPDFPERLDLEAAAAAGDGVLILDEQQSGERAGYVVSPAGDFDQDGLPDFLVGAPRATARSLQFSGRAYLVYGGGHLPRRASLGAVGRTLPGLSIPGERSWDSLGEEFGFLGDVSGDGRGDIMLNATLGYARPDVTSTRTRRLYILFGGLEEALELARVEPPFGSLDGGYTVALRGWGFGAGLQVSFGGLASASVQVVSSSEALARVPRGGAIGAVGVEVRRGASVSRAAEAFEYVRDLPRYDLASPSPGVLVLRGSSRTRVLGHALAAGDLDGDGISDLALAFLGDDRRPKVAVLAGGATAGGEVALEEIGGRQRGWVLSIDDELAEAGEVTLCVPGDIDGDGRADLVVGTRPRAAYAVFGRSAWPREAALSELLASGGAARIVHGGFLFGGESRSGLRVAAAGDLDGDGLADIAIGMTQDGISGSVHIVAGRREWPRELDLAGGAERVSTIRGAGLGVLGDDLAGAGDFDADGLPDLTATSYHSFQDVRTGRAWLIYGDDFEAEQGVLALRGAGGATEIVLEEGFAHFKESRVAGGADLDADGYGDVLIGVQGAGEGFEGAVFVLHGGPERQARLAVPGELAGGRGTVLRGDAPYAQTLAVSALGDFDGDGTADVVVGAPGSRTAEGTPGKAYVVLGAAGARGELSLARLGGRGFAVEGVNPFGAAGYEVAAAGDFDGDGLPDVAISEREGFEAPGNVYVLLNPLGGARFRRGDTTGDERVDISDGLSILSHLFLRGAAPACRDAADADESGAIDISDAIRIFGFLFLGSPPPPPPGPHTCGVDLTADALDCRSAPCGR
jgi:hypothetical protein